MRLQLGLQPLAAQLWLPAVHAGMRQPTRPTRRAHAPGPRRCPVQALYEAVRTDRNLYSKNLIEAQDEINELKRKFKIQAHQVRGRRVGAWPRGG